MTPLSDAEIERYARQIIVPGIGAAGQSALCASRVALGGNAASNRTVLSWLRALGCRVVAPDEAADCVIIADAGTIDHGTWRNLMRAGCPILWYALAGSHLRAGIVRPGEAPPDTGTDMPEALAEDSGSALHDVAACDIVASAAALILRWRDAELAYEVELT